MNIAEHVERGAREHPHRPALLFEGRTLTYRKLDEASSGAARVFEDSGVRAGSRVALFLPNIPEFAIAYLGALKCGAIAVSISSGSKRDEVAFVLADCRPTVTVTTEELRGRVPDVAAGRVFTAGADFDAALAGASAGFRARCMAGSDPAAIVYTAGTTGRPKGATLSHANVKRNIEAKRRYLDIRGEDRGLLFLPLYHCFGQNAVFNALLHAGGTVVLQRRFAFDRVLESIPVDGITMFFGVPATYNLLFDKVSRNELSRVRLFFSAAAPLPLEMEERWLGKFGAPIYQGYGLTETSPFASYNHLSHYRPGSIGTPIEGVEMKIVEPETGRDLGPGETGEIAIRGHNVMLGYWNRPEDTARAVRGGWFHTGDIGRRDADGYFFIQDRLTDLIISGGVNVYPAEVENVLHAHPAVAEAAVYGIPEPVLGERVRADIVLKPGFQTSAAEIRAFCRDRLADMKTPGEVHFTAEIPRSPAGKILKTELRKRAWAQAARMHTEKSAGRAEIREWIAGWLRDNLDVRPGGDFVRTPFSDLGMDSILAVRFAGELGEWLGRRLDVTAPWNFSTAEALAQHLSARPRPEAAHIANLSDEDAETLLMAELEELNR